MGGLRRESRGSLAEGGNVHEGVHCFWGLGASAQGVVLGKEQEGQEGGGQPEAPTPREGSPWRWPVEVVWGGGGQR